MCLILKIPPQEDDSSCGIIMLHLCENIISFAERCKYDFNVLSELNASDVSVQQIVQSTNAYRLRLGHLLRSLFECAIECSKEEQEGYSYKSDINFCVIRIMTFMLGLVTHVGQDVTKIVHSPKAEGLHPYSRYVES